MSQTEQPFSRRAAAWLVGVAGVSLLVSLALVVLVDAPREVPSTGSDTFSRSALGHRGLVDLLRDQGVPVAISRFESAARAGEGTLIVAEARGSDSLEELLAEVSRAVIVLPKRRGEPDPQKPEWVASADLVPADEPNEVLRRLGLDEAEVVRSAASLTLDVNETDFAPSLDHPQLIRTDELRSLIAGPDGVLVGIHSDDYHDWLVVADPDLFANHGLATGDNAALVLALLDDFRDGGALVFDETLHGHVLEPSVWNELAHFPLSLATLSALLVLGALLWSAGRRFGPIAAAPPAIAPGKQFLVDNTAALLAHGGHAAETLARYHAACLSDIAGALHVTPEQVPAIARARELPAELDPDELAREVAQLSQPSSLGKDRAAARALAVAVRLHRFRQEMIHGSASHRRAAR